MIDAFSFLFDAGEQVRVVAVFIEADSIIVLAQPLERLTRINDDRALACAAQVVGHDVAQTFGVGGKE